MLLDFHALHQKAKQSLKRTDRHQNAVLLHTGAILLISLLLTVADFFLNQQIGTTGGLSGMDTRSVLATIQTILRLVQVVALPFWSIGYTYYILRIAQNEPAEYSDLLQGFRRWLPVLRLRMLMIAFAFGLMLICSYAGSFLFMLTPWSAPLMEAMAELGNTTDQQLIMDTFLSVSQSALIPAMVICTVLFCIASIFVFFRYRMAEFWLMAHPEGGAFAALRNSRIAMKGNCIALLKVDLHFWWFYLLDVLIGILCYGDQLLSSLGMEMTNDAFIVYLLFFGLYLLARLGLYYWKRNEISATYAHAYLALCPNEEPAQQEAAV